MGRSGHRLTAVLLVPGILAGLLAGGARAAHPNHSIAPRPPPPTEYGLVLHRESDARFRGLDAQPPLGIAPVDVTDLKQQLSVLGSFDDARIAPLLQIAERYRDAGRHVDALDYFERAAYQQRLLFGLRSAQQLPTQEAVFASQLALGRLDLADQTREHVLFLERQAQLDPEDRLRALRRYSEWKRQLYLAGEGYETYRYLVAMWHAHDDEVERLAAIDPQHPAQIPHLQERLRLEYLISRYEGEKPRPVTVHTSGGLGTDYTLHTDLAAEEFRVLRKHNYRNGRRAAERIIALLDASPVPDARALAAAYIAAGDWHLWCDQKAPALASYRRAWSVYAGDGDPATAPADLFPAPVALPAGDVFFVDGVVAQAERPGRARVSFDVSRLGGARQVEVLEVEPAASRGARAAIYRMLRQMRFRPVLRDGEPVDAGRVSRVYRFDY
jgi:hypothetical protein